MREGAAMGTRADFYLGRGADAEWLGSIAWDGYPSGVREVLAAKSEKDFRSALASLATREDWTSPELGWPWPWKDSCTTDFAYAFDDGRAWWSCFGSRYNDGGIAAYEAYEERDLDDDGDEENEEIFPDMTKRMNPALGTPRDSMMVFVAPKRIIGGGGEE